MFSRVSHGAAEDTTKEQLCQDQLVSSLVHRSCQIIF